jgi:hypothetical protein
MDIIIIILIICCSCCCIISGGGGYYYITTKKLIKPSDNTSPTNKDSASPTNKDSALPTNKDSISSNNQGNVQQSTTTQAPTTTTQAPTTTKFLGLYEFKSHIFTTAGKSGSIGPTLTEVKQAYSSVSWAQNSDFLNMKKQGIQEWKVPVTGNYKIQAIGAAGGNSDSFGKGRSIEIDTTLTKGDIVHILVGQKGGNETVYNFKQAGGGGGSFVVKNGDTPIIVAGGGGGNSNNSYANSNASNEINGNKGGNGSSIDGDGGINGGGGKGAKCIIGDGACGGGGGGFNENGTAIPTVWSNGDKIEYSTFGFSFKNGGEGGPQAYGGGGGAGGFGGGAGCGGGGSGSGGGGYSGGGGGSKGGNSGGGGGSYAISIMKDNGAINNGDGSVTITLIN